MYRALCVSMGLGESNTMMWVLYEYIDFMHEIPSSDNAQFGDDSHEESAIASTGLLRELNHPGLLLHSG